MNLRTLVVALLLVPLLAGGCNGSGGAKGLHASPIEGPVYITEYSSVEFSIFARGDTGIMFQWTVDPPTAGTITSQCGSVITFTAAHVTSDTKIRIQAVVTSDNGDPQIRSQEVIVRVARELTVSEILGPDLLNENSSGSYCVTAGGDDGISYRWSCVPADAGEFVPPDSANTVFTPGEVAQATTVRISVEVNSFESGPIVRTLDVSVMNVPTPVLTVGAIDGPQVVYENSEMEYSVTASGDTGINFKWTCDPPGAGVFQSPESATAVFIASEVTEDTNASLSVTVVSDNCPPETRTQDIVVRVCGFTVGDIVGPAAIIDTTTASYSVDASGDSGITYQWSCSPTSAGQFDSPTSAAANFTAADVADDLAVVISVVVTSEHCGTIEKTLDAVVSNQPVTVGEISGPTAVDELTWATYGVSASGDTGIMYDWTCEPPDAGEFDNPSLASVLFRPSWVTQDTCIVIRVEVSSDHSDPVTRTLDVAVLDTPPFGWAVSWGGGWDDAANGMTADAYGNTYVVGEFSGAVDFDPGTSTDLKAGTGSWDAFLSKFDPDGVYLWSLTWGGTGASDLTRAHSVKVDQLGNIFVSGVATTGTIPLGPGLSIDLPDGPINYLMKVDPSGQIEWAQGWAGLGWSDYRVNSLALDSWGNAYVTGASQAWLAFLKAFDSDGNLLWEVTWNAAANAVTVDGAGDIYVAGDYTGAVDLDPGAGDDEHVSASLDAYVSKFDPTGAFLWARTWGGASANTSRRSFDVAADYTGNVFVAGSFADTFDFDSGPGVFERTSNGALDAFVTKFDANGEFLGACTWGGPSVDGAFGIAVDSSGNVYTTGRYSGPADFNPGPDVFRVEGDGTFLSKLSGDGAFVWARAWNSLVGTFVAAYDLDSVYVAGLFLGTADFNPTLEPAELTSNGGSDAYLTKFSPDGDW